MTDSAVEAARKTVEHYKRTGFAYDAGALKFAIALLSSQSQVERMREALEMAYGTLLIASRMLTEDYKMALNGKRWGDKTIKAVNAAFTKEEK